MKPSFLSLAGFNVILFSVAAILSAQPCITFDTQQYAVGDTPRQVAVADFNNDGSDEFAVTNYGANSIQIFRNNGGALQIVQTFSTGSGPYRMANGYYNNDPFLDIAVANAGETSISVYMNNGNGTFAEPVTYNVNGHPEGILAGDVNGDSRDDLAISFLETNQVVILLNNGSGGFTNGSTYAVGEAPDALVFWDFNRNGKLDIAVVNSGAGTVSVLLGNGDGTFANAASYSASGSYANSLVTADYTGDQIADLVVSAGNVYLLPGNGDGTFGAPIMSSQSSSADSITNGDFDGDGDLDLAVSSGYRQSQIAILINDGTGRFSEGASYPAANYPEGMFPGDFNGDGGTDLVVTESGLDSVRVYLNRTPVYLFSFDSSHWSFGYAPGFFDAPNESVSNGRLRLQATNNNNTFGFFESGVLSMEGISSTDYLLAGYRVYSDVSDSSRVPQLRLRVNAGDFSHAYYVAVDSRLDGAGAPTSAGGYYPLVYPRTTDLPRFAFDLLNFDTQDDPNGDLQLDTFEIRCFHAPYSPDTRVEKTWSFFSGGTNGWTSGGAPAFEMPTFDSTSGLAMTGRSGSSNTFGFWTSPADAITIDSGRVYVARFGIDSNVPQEDVLKAPAVRARLNEGGFHVASYMVAESTGSAEFIPTNVRSQTMTVVFLPPPSAHGQPLLASLDFLSFDPNDDAGYTYKLTYVGIESTPLPAP